MPLIQLDSVTKIYGYGDATTIALNSASLSIDKNEFIAIMGPSGSGKSTLLNILGLLDKPTSGTYKINAKLIDRLTNGRLSKLRRDTIGFIFQSYNLLPKLNVLDNVALPLTYKGLSYPKRIKIAEQTLERVGMQNRGYFYPSQLSGGQIQCTAIARALVNSPSIIIADEPTGNLDSKGSRLVMEILSDIHRHGNTIIFVTHNPELTRYATRVIYMHDGQIIGDELTEIGQIAKTAKRNLYYLTQKTVDDDLEGVSVLMKAIPLSSGSAFKVKPEVKHDKPKFKLKTRRHK